MPIIYRMTGDAKYARLAADLEQFLRKNVEGRFWFTGAHVDLPAKDYESDSVWHAVEYWLDKYDRTRDPEALKRAEADARLGFLTWCPKQLPWVKNPTQTCHTEQQNYLQYSNYCYNNRKYCCLDRLGKLTGEPLFGQLCQRLIQCGFWAQPTSGDWIGGMNERMCDPWLALSGNFNSTAQVYSIPFNHSGNGPVALRELGSGGITSRSSFFLLGLLRGMNIRLHLRQPIGRFCRQVRRRIKFTAEYGPGCFGDGFGFFLQVRQPIRNISC